MRLLVSYDDYDAGYEIVYGAWWAMLITVPGQCDGAATLHRTAQ